MAHFAAYVAVATSHGVISLRSAANLRHATKEFCPRILRAPNDLAWRAPSLLAAGYERAKGEGAVLVFDAAHSPATFSAAQASASRFFGAATREEKVTAVRAFRELSQGDTCHSLDFLADANAPVLAAGLNSKSLRLFDLREATSQAGVKCEAVHRAVFGLRADPTSEVRLATFYENLVCLWDTRMFFRPVQVTVQEARVASISWHPQCSGKLCIALAGCDHVVVDEVRAWPQNEGEEASVAQRQVPAWRQPALTQAEAAADPAESHLRDLNLNKTVS